jgi:hypothetical protein
MIISVSLHSVLAKKLFQTARKSLSYPLPTIRAQLYPRSRFYQSGNRLLSNLRSSSPEEIPNNPSALIGDNEVKDFSGKAKGIWKEYGYLAIGTHLTIYLATLGAIYTCLEFDIFNSSTFGLDPAYAIEKVKFWKR